MTEDQPAQIDCRVLDCIYYAGKGICVNVSPAITLNNNGSFACWSKKLITDTTVEPRGRAMGTRNLTAVFYNGEYKVAQYGQWDGYPEGQGVTALNFIRDVDLNKFKQRLDKVRFLTEEEKKDIELLHGDGWVKHYPYLSRDVAAEILTYVMNGADKLINRLCFAGDSLFCEYGYVIDLDKETFEVYEGFNKTEITDGRFLSSDKSLEHTEGYEPIKLLKLYRLIDLPSNEQFLKDTESKDNINN